MGTFSNTGGEAIGRSRSQRYKVLLGIANSSRYDNCPTLGALHLNFTTDRIGRHQAPERLDPRCSRLPLQGRLEPFLLVYGFFL